MSSTVASKNVSGRVDVAYSVAAIGPASTRSPSKAGVVYVSAPGPACSVRSSSAQGFWPPVASAAPPAPHWSDWRSHGLVAPVKTIGSAPAASFGLPAGGGVAAAGEEGGGPAPRDREGPRPQGLFGT